MIPPAILLPAKADVNVIKSAQQTAALLPAKNDLMDNTQSIEVSAAVVVDMELLWLKCFTDM